jgi:hypothetical protein
MTQGTSVISWTNGGVAVVSWSFVGFYGIDVWRITMLVNYDVAVGRRQIRLMRKREGKKGTGGVLQHGEL